MIGQKFLLTILNLKKKKCLFGATFTVKKSDEGKWAYSSYGIAFDGAGSLNFVNDLAKNVAIFGVDSSSSYHTDNLKNNFRLLGEGPTYGINRSFGEPEKKFYLLIKQVFIV